MKAYHELAIKLIAYETHTAEYCFARIPKNSIKKFCSFNLDRQHWEIGYTRMIHKEMHPKKPVAISYHDSLGRIFPACRHKILAHVRYVKCH